MKNKLMIMLFIVLLASFAAAFEMDLSGLQDSNAQSFAQNTAAPAQAQQAVPVQQIATEQSSNGFDFTNLLADNHTQEIIQPSVDMTEQLAGTSQLPFIDIASRLSDSTPESVIDTSPDEFGLAGKLKDSKAAQTMPADTEFNFASKLADEFDALAEGLKDSRRSRITRNATGYYKGQSIKLVNSRREELPIDYTLKSERNRLADKYESIAKGNYTGEIWIDSPTVQYIYFKDLEINETVDIKFDDETKEQHLIDTYSIDASNIKFHHATITRTAKANTLLKCKEWNFETQTCEGMWQRARTLTPGESYTIAITPGDPGFGEINITNATHLASDYSFIANIYNETKDKDNVWTGPISENEFVRVKYQANLTNGNVIDIFVRNPNMTNTHIEIYSIGTTSPVLGRSKVFNSTGEWDYITVSNLSAPIDMFDFKIINTNNNTTGFLEIDYLHDADRALNDNSLTANDTNITVRDYITVTGTYTVGNGKSTGNWIIGLNDTNNAINLNTACGAGSTFQVTSINLAGCSGCTNTGSGTVTVPDNPNGGKTIVWTLRACLGASAYSPANLLTYRAGGTSTGAYTFNDQTGDITINADVTPPVINAVNATPNTVFKGQSINITANVTDNIQVDQVWVDIEGTNYTMNPTGGDIWWYYFSTAGFYVGVHNYTVHANDTSGNNATPVTGNYTVLDSSAPTSNSPPDQTVDIGTDTTIPWILQDETSPGYYFVERQGALFKGPLAWLNNTNLNVKPNTFFTGIWNYTIYFNDSIGNNGTPDTVFITVIDNSTINCSDLTGTAGIPVLTTITIDGNVSDWDAVLANPMNYQTDLSEEAGDLDNPGTADRDLVNFAYTWDNQYLYFYFRRVNTGKNQVSMIVYLDYDLDGYMNATDKVIKFVWFGSNAKYDSDLYNYIPAGGTPDLMNGSGYNMPGTITLNKSLEQDVPGGTNPGIVLETRVAWNNLSFSGPAPINFQAASALGAGTNLPSQLEDNVDTKDTLYSAILFQPDRFGSATNATTVYYDHNLGNCGLTTETIDLYKISSQGYNVTLYYPNGTIIPDTTGDNLSDVTLGVYNFTRIIVRIDIPASAASGTTDVTNITAIPSNFPVYNKTVTDTTSIGAITIIPNLRIISGTAGMTATLNYTVTNQQAFNDTLLIGAVSSQGWPFAIYYNGTLINNSLGGFDAGESKIIQLKIYIPANATIGTLDTTTITVNSSLNPLVTATATAKTTVRARLTLNPDYARSIGIGTSRFYLLTLTNSWNASDAFDITYTSVLNWSTQFFELDKTTPLIDTNNNSYIDTGIVSGQGGIFQFYVKITSPLNAQENDTEITTVYANASSNPAIYDTAQINTTVETIATYNDTARTQDDQLFEIFDTVYTRANGLVGINKVYFVWLDSNNTPVRTSPDIPVTSEDNADDAFTTNNTLPIGNYTIIVYNAQNNNELSRTKFIVFVLPPIPTLIFPGPGYLNNFSIVNFNWTTFDKYRTALTCDLYINGALNASNISVINGTFENFTVSGFQEGYYNWSTICRSDFYQVSGTSVTNSFITNFPPKVYPDYNELAVPFLLNETAMIRANETDFFGISANYANITLPNGTVMQVILNNTLNDTYEKIFSNLLLRGRYNITFYAKDGFNAVNATETAYFIRKPYKIIDIINGSLDKYYLVDFNVSVLRNDSGTLDLNISVITSSGINSTKLTKITVYNHSETAWYSVIRVETELNENNESFVDAIATDLSGINLTSANYTIGTNGYHVLKCTNFSWQNLSCADEFDYRWVKDTYNATQYTVLLNYTDPSFATTVLGNNTINDSTLAERTPNVNFGRLATLRTGRAQQANSDYHSIIRFNLTGIPSDVEIINATLQLYYYEIQPGDDQGNRNISVHRVQQNPTRDWAEMDVTWNDYNATSAWTSAGGDYNATPTDTATFNSTAVSTFISWNVTRDVQSFADNRTLNYGWVVKDDVSASRTRRNFRSKEAVVPAQRPRLLIAWKPKQADLIPINLTFSDNNPREGDNVTIYAVILNNGTKKAENFTVQFFDGSCSNGTQINGNITIAKLKKGENITVNVTWNASQIGPHNISVCVDPNNIINESNKTNNNLTRAINVKAWQLYYGNVTGNITLATSANMSLYEWQSDIGVVYAISADTVFNFSTLQALGRNKTGGLSSNDFAEADINLNMTGFNDSVQLYFAVNASLPKQTMNFTVYNRTIQFVPYINSTNTSDFVTGILWDTRNDTDGQYGTADNEPLVFVANINKNKQGRYGIYDYEIFVPRNLARYKGTSDIIELYAELH